LNRGPPEYEAGELYTPYGLYQKLGVWTTRKFCWFHLLLYYKSKTSNSHMFWQSNHILPRRKFCLLHHPASEAFGWKFHRFLHYITKIFSVGLKISLHPFFFHDRYLSQMHSH
jgi:hypothetical protein